MAKRSDQEIGLGRRGRRTGRMGWINGLTVTAEVPENPLDRRWLLDAGDHPQLPATTSAGLYVNGEHALATLRWREGINTSIKLKLL